MLRAAFTASLVLLAAIPVVRAADPPPRADIARIDQFARAAEGKVYKARLAPHWLADKTRFWYRNDLPGQAREFILVDATKGERKPAFDHARLAAALSKVMGRTIPADRLPIDGLTFLDNGTLLLRGGSDLWKCDLASYSVARHTGDEGLTPAKRVGQGATSQKSGSSTFITFVNRTEGEAELFWVDGKGKHKSYAKLAPDKRKRMQTYGGHVWLAADAKGKTIAVFEAPEELSLAAIEPAPPEAAKPGPPGRDQSPDGKWTALVKEHNVYVRNKASGKETALSRDGTEDDPYGGPFSWSPDSKKLVALRTKKGGDRRVHYVESSPTDQLQPKLHSYHYLKPGDPIPQPRPRLFDVNSRRPIAIDESLFPNPWSCNDVQWQPDSRRFTFIYNQRGHQVLRVVAVDAATGAARAVIDEQSKTFIDYPHKQYLHRVEDTSEMVWMSERDGWNHLWLYDGSSGTVKNQITRGEWVVRGVDRIDDEKRQVWFRAGGVRPQQDPYYIHYCRVNFDGTGLTVLTEGDGQHDAQLSPDGRWFVDSWSRVDRPPVHELRRSDDGRLVCTLEEADWSELLATGWQTPERFVAKGRDGTTDIYGVVFRPTTFRADQKYPVIEDIYAGPHSAFVPKAFRAFHGSQWLAEFGFVVVKIDGMGTSHRSKAFHDVCWKNLGDAGLPDRIAWIKAAAAKYPAIDTTRVGIYGGSAGGQSTVRALLMHGDFYRVGVADCGCHDNRMDKVWWNELWMGWPIGPHYAEQSNVTQAHRLQGKLMLVVGEMDENVDPASTMQVANALIKADKDFELVLMTGKGHGAAESPYGKRRRADFFVRHLLTEPPK